MGGSWRVGGGVRRKRNICFFHVALARSQPARWWYLRPVTGPLSHLVVIPSVRPQATTTPPKPPTHPSSPLNPPRPCGTSFTSCCAESVTHCSPGGSRPRLKRGFNSALVRTLLSNARAVIGFNDSDAELFKCFQRPKLIAIRLTPNRCVLLLMIDFQTTETRKKKKN